MTFKANVQFQGATGDAVHPLVTIEDVIEPRIIIESDDFPTGQHIEIKLSEDGGIIIEAFDENEGDFINSRIIRFDEVVDEIDVDLGGQV